MFCSHLWAGLLPQRLRVSEIVSLFTQISSSLACLLTGTVVFVLRSKGFGMRSGFHSVLCGRLVLSEPPLSQL